MDVGMTHTEKLRSQHTHRESVTPLSAQDAIILPFIHQIAAFRCINAQNIINYPLKP